MSLYCCSAKSLILVKHAENKLDGFVKRRNSIEGVIPAKAGIQLFQDVLDPGFRRGDDPRDFLRDGQVQITFGFESLNLRHLSPLKVLEALFFGCGSAALCLPSPLAGEGRVRGGFKWPTHLWIGSKLLLSLWPVLPSRQRFPCGPSSCRRGPGRTRRAPAPGWP